LPEKYVLKISKMPKFYMIFARKIIKISKFYDIRPKNLQNSRILVLFYMIFARKIPNVT